VSGLQLRGIAEGIETRAQATTLLAQGWTHGQGYLYGRPTPVPATTSTNAATRPGEASPAG
jgi:EAL domain-containing protein (putative c-di-GMP-specific phosphodiesterase class I)